MYKLDEFARIVKAQLVGDPNIVVRRARPFEEAEEGDVTLAMSPSYRELIEESKASAVIVAPPIEDLKGTLLVTATPKLAFARAIQALHQTARRQAYVSPDLSIGDGSALGNDVFIHPRVTIGSNTLIGDRAVLHPGVVIGDGCHIGDQTILYPNVSVYSGCRVGKRVVIHAGTVVGADGFGFVPDEEGRQVKFLHLGSVRIEDDCEIGANCAIDRGGFGDTLLKQGVKLDNLIQVGHNTQIGENTVVAALTGFSGGTRIGQRCVIAGQVGTNQHVTIGDDAIIAGQAGVTKNVKAGAVMGGTIPAQDHRAWRRSQVLYSKLPEIVERLKRLEDLIQEEGRR